MQPTHFERKEKFLGLPPKRQHKNLAELLKKGLKGQKSAIVEYKRLAQWLNLDVKISQKQLYDRFHMHLAQADVSIKEHDYLPKISKGDKAASHHSFLPYVVALDSLRSADNVGQIVRTVEAFRLGQVAFLGSTPDLNHLKVQKTSMGSYKNITSHDVSNLPRPWIVIETADNSSSILTEPLPQSGTLIFGNEEYGVSDFFLKNADAIFHIPLFGLKNSLNVAASVAIVAAEAVRQYRS